MSDQEQATKFLWQTLGRIDGYITSTNAKGSILLAFNSFILGGFILKAHEYLGGLTDDWACITGVVLVSIIGLASLVSLWITVSVVQPILDTNKRPGEYQSRVFFGDIAEFSSAETFAAQATSASPAEMASDLAQQVHVVAGIACRKFRRLRCASRIAIFLQCPILSVLLALNLTGTA